MNELIEPQTATRIADVPPAFAPTPPPAVAVIPSPAAPPAQSADPEFDAYLSAVRLLIGGAVEGTAELAHRLERWEAELRAAEAAPEPSAPETPGDVARFMLVGLALAAGDEARRQVVRLAQASDVVLRLGGSAAQPFVNNRLTGRVVGPFDRAFDRLATRGRQRVNGWIALGREQEPHARLLARKAYVETIDEFISLLAENQELADLVQKKSVGLATEAVDEIRSRTVSADAIAEGLVRRILRRPPRGELPPPPEHIRQALDDAVDSTEPAQRS